MPESIPVYAHHRCWCSKLSPTIHLMAALGSLWVAAEKLGSSWSLLLASHVQKTSNRICAVRQLLTEKKFKKWRQEEEWGEDKQAETLLGVLPPAPAASLEGTDSGHHRNTYSSLTLKFCKLHWNYRALFLFPYAVRHCQKQQDPNNFLSLQETGFLLLFIYELVTTSNIRCWVSAFFSIFFAGLRIDALLSAIETASCLLL